jgi:TonB family protein
VGLVIGGCARPEAPARAAPSAVPLEDAVPHYYEAHEVDSPPRLLAPIEPAYPREPRARGQEGEVVARVLVRPDGSVGGAKLVRATDDAFVEAARDSIQDARFAPALRSGRPVFAWVTVRVRFRLG